MTSGEEFKARARARKAARLAEVARRMIEAAPTLSARLFENVPAETRRHMEAVAGLPTSSDETWALVYVILRESEEHPDPFVGLTPEEPY